jgi:UV DNA damage repair endonuclease
MTARVGFCCKWIDTPEECAGRKPTSESRDLNGRSTTMRWLREHPEEAEQRQWDIMNHNAQAALNMVERVGSLRPELRMVRLGSEMLQGYTEPNWIDWWQQTDVQDHLAKIFAPIGARARELGVRLDFHPGQFCVLASENDNIVERSILEFEYHADMARWMGYGSTWHDQGFGINVHLSGRGGVEKFLRTLGRLSPEARNLITIENDEISNGLDITLAVADHVALVLDVHHHFVKTGEYISSQDDRVQRVIESWRGVRPLIHYSLSREDVLVDHDPGTPPDLQSLLARGFTKQKLRAHSDFMWNHAVNRWVKQHWSWTDIEVESKGKNLASFGLLEFWERDENTVGTILEPATHSLVDA